MTQEALKYNRTMWWWSVFSLLGGVAITFLFYFSSYQYQTSLQSEMIFMTYFLSTLIILSFGRHFMFKFSPFNVKSDNQNEQLTQNFYYGELPKITIVEWDKAQLSYTEDIFEKYEGSIKEPLNENSTYMVLPKNLSSKSLVSSLVFYHEMGHLRQILKKGKMSKFLHQCLWVYKNPYFENLLYLMILYTIYLVLTNLQIDISNAWKFVIIVFHSFYVVRVLSMLYKEIECEIGAYRETQKEAFVHCKDVPLETLQQSFNFTILVWVSSYIAYYLLWMYLLLKIHILI